MRKKTTNILGFILAIFPVLIQYKSLIPGITLGELLLIIMIPAMLYYFKIKKDIRLIVKSRLLCKMLYNVFTISTYQN
ncbi:hypothetical protein CYQ72_10280 [Enterococcus faecium]|nr:hypothetical protein CYQ72_10280 [Enterococcus faecium]